MKKNFNFLLLTLLALMFVVSSCSRKDDFNGVGISASSQKIKGGITGRVTDQNNLPVRNAIVSAYGKVVQTDINGEFKIQSVTMPKYYGYVKVEKAEYFTGSRTFTATKEGALNHVEIQLIPKTIRGTFASYEGGSITFDGVSLNFAPNSIVRADGLPYSGPVTLVGAHLNPEASNFSRIMPGNLVGENTSGVRRGLESFGMMAVELQGSGGEKLQIIAGMKVDMKMDIPASKLASAPTSLPLWYFDEEKGMWKEEGEAVLQNGQYVGQVGHFSYWNCDYGGPVIHLDATFIDVNGNPVTNVEVSITATSINDTRSAWTDNNGSVSGDMPYGSALVINVIDNCGNIIYTQNAGPYTSNINLGTITITSPNYVIATYTGSVTDCNNALVTNGFVKVTVGATTSYHSLVNGMFSVTIPACVAGAPVSIEGVDATSITQSAAYTTTLAAGVQNIGNLAACGGIIAEYIQFTVDGVPYVALLGLNCGTDSAVATTLDFSGMTGTNEYISFKLDNNGAYTLTSFMLYGTSLQYPVSYTTTAMNVINWANAIGLFANGGFSLTYLDQASASHTVVVNYHLTRTN